MRHRPRKVCQQVGSFLGRPTHPASLLAPVHLAASGNGATHALCRVCCNLATAGREAAAGDTGVDPSQASRCREGIPILWEESSQENLAVPAGERRTPTPKQG